MRPLTLTTARCATLCTLLLAITAPIPTTAADPQPYATDRDAATAQTISARSADWRNGTIVYQVIVDRFAPPADLDAKRALYPPPKTLHPWTDVPRPGREIRESGVWSHEIDFWGGDIPSLQSRLGYIHELGVDTLYLNPIAKAFTNHKYDTQDYFQVSEEYGTRDDVTTLASSLHSRGLRLVLDGVFNHMGRTAPSFQDALKNPQSPWRDWFYIDPSYRFGYRSWIDIANLPELNLENPEVRARLWGDADSVIQGYLRDGADGWRLDVAFDIGFKYLTELTTAAHAAKPGSVVIGEVWNYPAGWSPALDGVMNMTAREMILQLCRGNISAPHCGRLLERLVADCGLEFMLKSWLILDNHDTPRLTNLVRDPGLRRLAQVLQFTVPGSPCVYYGTELGMEGGEDPANRAPMRWDLAASSNEQLNWTRELIRIRKASPALRVGEFRILDSEKLLAFSRSTDRIADLRIIVANPSDEPTSEVLVMRDPKMMSSETLRDQLSSATARTMSGTVTVTVPARTAMILSPVLRTTPGYTPFKRVQ